MKKLIPIFLILFATVIPVIAQADTLRFEPVLDGSDSVEYELIVLDPGYESFLVGQLPMEYYSQQHYEMWNYRYVTEWNQRYLQATVYGDLYESYIDYRTDINYGLELNYRLYYYFRFFEKENGLDLLPGKVF